MYHNKQIYRGDLKEGEFYGWISGITPETLEIIMPNYGAYLTKSTKQSHAERKLESLINVFNGNTNLNDINDIIEEASYCIGRPLVVCCYVHGGGTFIDVQNFKSID